MLKRLRKLLVQSSQNKETKSETEKSIYEVEFDAKGDFIVIERSALDQGWTRAGTVASTLKNHGNGFTVRLDQGSKKGFKTIELDYSQADYLRVMLNLHTSLYHKDKEYRIKDSYYDNVADMNAKKQANTKRFLKKTKKLVDKAVKSLYKGLMSDLDKLGE